MPRELGIDLTAHYEDVRRLVCHNYWRLIRDNGWDLDDIIQQVLLAIAVRNGGTCPFDPERSSLAHYILLVAQGVIRNLHRQQVRHDLRERVATEPDLLAVERATGSLLGESERFLLEDLLAALSPDEGRTLTWLAEGRTITSIRRSLGKGVPPVGELQKKAQAWAEGRVAAS